MTTEGFSINLELLKAFSLKNKKFKQPQIISVQFNMVQFPVHHVCVERKEKNKKEENLIVLINTN